MSVRDVPRVEVKLKNREVKIAV